MIVDRWDDAQVDEEGYLVLVVAEPRRALVDRGHDRESADRLSGCGRRGHASDTMLAAQRR